MRCFFESQKGVWGWGCAPDFTEGAYRAHPDSVTKFGKIKEWGRKHKWKGRGREGGKRKEDLVRLLGVAS